MYITIMGRPNANANRKGNRKILRYNQIAKNVIFLQTKVLLKAKRGGFPLTKDVIDQLVFPLFMHEPEARGIKGSIF